MGERLVRTEVGQEIFKQLATELKEIEKEQDREKSQRKRVITEASEQAHRIRNMSDSKRLISQICITPQNNANSVNYDSLWGVASSIDMINNYKNQIKQNCKDQNSFQKYFSDKNFSTPYIQSKIKNASQKIIPEVTMRQKQFIIKTAIKQAELNKTLEHEKQYERRFQSSKCAFFNQTVQGSISTKTYGSSSTQKDAPSRIQEKLKNIQELNKELAGERTQQLMYLEQKIEQLSKRQIQYEQYRQKLKQQISNQLSDIKSFIYQPPTLEEMKKNNNPTELLNYDSSFYKASQKQAIAKIHNRKYSENWKKNQQSHKEPVKQHNTSLSIGNLQKSLFKNQDYAINIIK